MKYINTLTFAYELSVVDDKMNGYKNKDLNLLEKIDSKWLEFIYSNNVPVQLGYNAFTNKNYIYVCMSFLPSMNEDLIKELELEVTFLIKNLDLKSAFPKIKKKLSFTESETAKFLDKVALGNFIPVRFLFNNPDDVKVYERFSKSKIMRKHIDFICTTNGFGKPKEETSYENLPIHDFGISSNTLLIHSKIVPLFRNFKVAESYILKSETDELSTELGKLMLLDMKFADYLITTFSSIKEGDSPEKVQKVTTKVFNKASKTIKKNDVPENYYNCLESDVTELFGVVPVVNEFLTQDIDG
jgi:hypothetical protein